MITPPSHQPREEVAIPSRCLPKAHLRAPGPIQLQLITNIEAFGFMFSFCFSFLCLFSAPSPSPPGTPGKEADDDVIEGASSGHQAFSAPVTDRGMAGSAL